MKPEVGRKVRIRPLNKHQISLFEKDIGFLSAMELCFGREGVIDSVGKGLNGPFYAVTLTGCGNSMRYNWPLSSLILLPSDAEKLAGAEEVQEGLAGAVLDTSTTGSLSWDKTGGHAVVKDDLIIDGSARERLKFLPGTVKDVVDLIATIQDRTKEIERASANITTQLSKKRDAVKRLADLVGINAGSGNQVDAYTEKEILTAAEARIGRFYLYEFNRETKETALAKDR